MPSPRKPIRVPLVLATCAALALVLGMPAVSAQADPVYPSAGDVNAANAAAGGKAAQVGAVEAQLMTSNARLDQVRMVAEVASEKYNGARVLLQERTDAATAAGERAAAAQRSAGIASDKLGQFAAAVYRQGGNLGQLEAFLSSKGPQDVLDRAAGVQVITDIRSRIMQDADASSVVAGVLRRAAAQAQAQQLAAAQQAESTRAAAQAQVGSAAAESANIATQQSEMIVQLATLRNTSVALEGQRQVGLKAEADARAAAAVQARAAAQGGARDSAQRAAAAAEAERLRRLAGKKPVTSKPGPLPAPGPTPVFVPKPPVSSPVASSGGAAAAVAFARAQIGEPYEWGAAGPASWDCSGLTQKAWAQAGVNLSHYTGAQWRETRRIPLSDLQPGDLVFFGDSGETSSHVGLYIGNGTMIEAPYTGAVVRYAPISRGGLLPYGGRP